MKLRKKYGYLLIVFFIIIIIIFSMLRKNALSSNEVIEEELVENFYEVNKIENKIKVEIKGYVENPGVYELDDDSRVTDLIVLSGGLLDNADTSLINLSKKLKDEMVIIIYSKEEVANSNLKQIETVYKVIEKECVCPKIENDGCINTDIVEESNNLVNINTADLDTLQTIDGIGESKAKSIIEYRKSNGKFNSIEDIKNVSGIGESLFEKIKGNISV